MEVIHGVVLKITACSDTQKIVRVFSLEKGYLSLITPSYIFKRKRAGVNILQVVEVEYAENIRSGLHSLKSIAPMVALSSIYLDIFKMNIALLWGEVLDILLRKEQRNESLYNFICRSVEYLHLSSEDIANFNLFFLYRLATDLGFKINTDSYAEGYLFNVSDGRFVATDSMEPHVSGPNTAKVIYSLCMCKVEELKTISLNRDARRILLDIVFLYYAIHFNIDFNIKSIRVLREVFE